MINMLVPLLTKSYLKVEIQMNGINTLMILQRKGHGTMLLKQVEDYVKDKGLAGITLSTNKYAPAPKFYQKNGFKDCEHVLFMCKEM